MNNTNRGEPGGPVAGATATLLDWLSAAGVTPRLDAPGAGDPDSATIRVWPVRLLWEQAVRNASGPGPLRLRVRYLLACDAAPAEAAALLDRVLLASLAGGPVSLPAAPVTAGIWQAFGLPPQLGVYVDVAVQAHRPQPVAPRVRQALRVDGRSLARIHGQVVGPGGTPVPGIRVAVAATGAAVHTDHRGRFAFPAVPAGQPARLLLSGKGLELVADLAAPSDDPVVIHCDPEEV
ncbi:MAG TPA: carboxypeptidase-like regulatory domain-containing protein [Candidatus Limnocylindrales bacterium]